MTGQAGRFERAIGLFEMPEPAYQRMLEHRDLKVRRQRVTAAAVGIAVVTATAILIAGSFGGATSDRNVGTSVEPSGIRHHSGMGVSYVVPDGWFVSSHPDDLILSADDERFVIVSRDVWAGSRRCLPRGEEGIGPRCKTGPGGIFAWLESRDSLEVTRGIRPIGIGGYDAFRLGVKLAAGVTDPQPLLQRTDPSDDHRATNVVTLGPGTRALLHVVVTDRRMLAVTVVAPTGSFDAFADEAQAAIASLEFRG